MSLQLFLLSSLPEGRLFGLDQQTLVQIVAHFINIAILAFVLSKLLYKPVRNFMKNRSDKIAGEIANAKNELEKAHEIKAEYEEKLKGIEAERLAILEEARKQAAETGRNILSDAKDEAESVKSRANANVELEWDRAQKNLKHIIIDVSSAMTEKLIKCTMEKEAVQEKLFDETMTELEGIKWRS